MKITVFGAGAIGCVVAGRMASAGLDVKLIARGKTLGAIKKQGLTLLTGENHEVVKLQVTDDTSEVGPQDLVIISLMANTIRPALPAILPLIDSNTTVVAAQNGIPWWYFHALRGVWPKVHLDSLDPDGHIWKAIGPEKVLGCTVRMSASLPEPGVARYSEHQTYNLGEPDGSESGRLVATADAFATAGFNAPIDMDIRKSVWAKICSNIGVNPISVICNATMEQMCNEPRVCDVMRAILREVVAVAQKLGVELPADIEENVARGARLGAFRTSTLQSFDRGKPIEIDSIVGAISEIGRMVDVPTPQIDCVYALTRLRADVAGCYLAP